jgi:hypothetical protein
LEAQVPEKNKKTRVQRKLITSIEVEVESVNVRWKVKGVLVMLSCPLAFQMNIGSSVAA